MLSVSLFFGGYSHAESWNENSHIIGEADYNHDGLMDIILMGEPGYFQIPYDINVQVKGKYGSYVLQKNLFSPEYTLINAESEVALQHLELLETDYRIELFKDDLQESLGYILSSPTKDNILLNSLNNGTSAALGRIFEGSASEQINSVKTTDLNDDGRTDILFIGDSAQHVSLASQSGKFDSSIGLQNNDGSNVAAISGAASVSPQGSAQYQIPIQLPDSVGGLKPNLSFAYDSNGGHSLLGKAWSLSGLQSISRCRPTFATEGYGHSAPHSAEERFCLNGSKLVSVSGEYGADTTEYRTETDQFIKVISYGELENGSGPVYFKAWTKNGLILEFGNTYDSQQLVGTTVDSSRIVTNWALNKVSDLFNNTYSVQYTKENNIQYPTLINYSPSITIRFVYQASGDNLRYFKGGYEYSQNKRMAEVVIQKSGKNLRKYTLEYEKSPTTNWSRISEVHECGYLPDGTQFRCKQPTQLTWSPGEKGFEAAPTTLVSAPRATGRQPIQADMNGDGFLDLVWAHEYYWWIAEGYKNGFREPKKTTISKGAYGKYAGVATPIRIGNRNKSGLVVAYKVTSGGVMPGAESSIPYKISELFSWRIITFEADGDNYSTGVGSTIFQTLGSRPQIGDFNGDGREDMLVFQGEVLSDIYQDFFNANDIYNDYSNIDKGIEQSAPTFFAIQLDKEWEIFTELELNQIPYDEQEMNFFGHYIPDIYSRDDKTTLYGSKTADLNGDGLSDVLIRTNTFWQRVESYRLDDVVVADWQYDINKVYHKVYQAKKTQTIIPKGDGEQGNGTLIDLNQDGLADMMVRVNNNWNAYINTGKNFIEIETGISSTGDADKAIALDYNADGRGDLLINDEGSWKLITYRDFNFSLSELTSSSGSISADGYYVYEEGQTGGGTCEYINLTCDQVKYVDGALLALGDFAEEGEGPIPSDINGDGLIDILFYEKDKDIWKSLIHKNGRPDILTGLVDGMGRQTAFNYKPLTDSTVYTLLNSDTPENQFPYRPIRGAHQVVSRLEQSDGKGGLNAKTYTYQGAKVHLQGRGFLGFSDRDVTDLTLATTTRSHFLQQYPYIGAVESTTTVKGTVFQDNDNYLSDSVNSWSSKSLNEGKTRFPYLDRTASKRWEANGQLISATKTTRIYDDYGNVTNETVQTGKNLTDWSIAGSEQIVSTTNEYDPPLIDGDNWRIGFLNKKTVSSGGLSDVTSITPWQTTLVAGSITQYTGTNSWNTTSYNFDDYGNITSTALSGYDAEQRTTEKRSNFLDNLYPQTLKNAKSHEQKIEYDSRFGSPVKITDPNLLETAFKYDVWGRQIYQKDADGTETHIVREWCDNSCPTNGRYKVSTFVSHAATTAQGQAAIEGLGQAPSTVYYDIYDRELRRVSYNLDGQTVYQDTQYTNEGYVARTSLPYFKGGTPQWSNYTGYDIFGRPGSVSHPDGSSASMTYAHDTTFARRETQIITVKKPDASTSTQSTTSYFNTLGELKRTTDADNTLTDFTYDGFGRLKTTKVNNQSNTQVSMNYDIAGNKTRLTDPDAGRTDYTYDGLGQMLTQTDANARLLSDVRNTEFKYDTLGRMTRRIDNDGTFNWIYDTESNGIGLLAEMNGPDFKETYQYDAFSRLSTTSTELLGEAARVSSYAYDGYSRLSSMTFPSNFSLKNEYNWLGFKVGLKDAESEQSYWAATGADKFGGITEESFGNGVTSSRVYNQLTGQLESISTSKEASALQNLSYTYDSLGNLYSRSAAVSGSNLHEAFAYDNLNRLETATTTGLSGADRVLSYQYDALGNITYKSDVSDVNGYKYTNGRAHAVSSIVKSGQTTSFAYDFNGNATTSGNRTLEYNAFNKPTQIIQGNKQLDFKYGPEGSRFYQEERIDNELSQKTYYLAGGAYEEVVDIAKGETKRKTTIDGIMLHINTQPSAGVATSHINYLHTDVLGSTDLMTNAAGQVVERFAFDPFGQRRQEQWQNTDAAYESQLAEATYNTTTSGFTGHEQLDAVDLIHMNGRVYDPVFGRFLSADPYIQAPEFSQSYNRYSYVWNNPLSMTDPSGYIGNLVISWTIGGEAGALTYGAIAGAEALTSPNQVNVGSMFDPASRNFDPTFNFSNNSSNNNSSRSSYSYYSYEQVKVKRPTILITPIIVDVITSLPRPMLDFMGLGALSGKDISSPNANIGYTGSAPELLGPSSTSLPSHAPDSKPYLNVSTGEGRDYVTYTGVKGSGTYDGIASAPSSMGLSEYEIIARRYGGNFEEFIQAPLSVYSGTGIEGKRTARGLEQHNYEQNVKKFGKTGVSNAQNPVGKNNTNKDIYKDAAKEYLKKTGAWKE
tara:strand:- start:4147 stop:11085 length:6939 start_codon:yes stop_codon:yes gene_type:complete